MKTITTETTAAQAAKILNDAAIAECPTHLDSNSDANDALLGVLPEGSETVERENGFEVTLPTGQKLRLFTEAYSYDGIRNGGLGYDEHAGNADELGEVVA